jgi:hypothetical protein
MLTSMSRTIKQFKTLAFLRGGRISAFLDGKRTPVCLTKTLREVPHLDKEGMAERSAHWIIELGSADRHRGAIACAGR